MNKSFVFLDDLHSLAKVAKPRAQQASRGYECNEMRSDHGDYLAFSLPRFTC
jgi:hypothetical protein